MKPKIQAGTHPDAEILSAFAEQTVSEPEREEIIAHMAVCSRCREVVFLAQRAIEAEEPVAAAGQTPEKGTGGSWFPWWRWTWIPAAGLAGVVGFAVMQHVRHAAVPERQMAQNASPAETVRSGDAAKATGAAEAPPRPSRAEGKVGTAEKGRSDQAAESDRRELRDKDVAVEKKDELAKAADSVSGGPAKLSSSNVREHFEARAKSSSVGGPLAQNQIQAQNNTQLQQNYANEVRQNGALAESANKPVGPTSQPGSVSQTVSVEAAGAPVPVSPAPAAPVLSAGQVQAQSVELREQKLAKGKAAKMVLPSKLEVLSAATVGKRTVAVDTAGALFVSEDGGKHWQGVKAVWSGRAVEVKERTAVAGVGGIAKSSPTQFVLTTDELENWVSEDGKAWRLEKPPTR